MNMRSILKGVAGWFGAERKTTSRPNVRRASLAVEALEDRVVLQGAGTTSGLPLSPPPNTAPAQFSTTQPGSMTLQQQVLNATNQVLSSILQKHVWTPQQRAYYFNAFVYQCHFSPDLANYVIQYHDNLVKLQVFSLLTPGPISPNALQVLMPAGPTGMTYAPNAEPGNATTGWNDSSAQVTVAQALQIAHHQGVDAAVNYLQTMISPAGRQELLYAFGYGRLANTTGSSADGYRISHDPTLLLLTGQWIVDAVNNYIQRFVPYAGMNGNFGAVAASVGLPTGVVGSAYQASMVGQGNGGGALAIQNFPFNPNWTMAGPTSSSGFGGLMGMFGPGVNINWG
jgi:hypothetical protein